MPLWDLSGEALRRHRCTTPEPDDLDPFWVGTLEAAQGLATTSSRRGSRTSSRSSPSSGGVCALWEFEGDFGVVGHRRPGAVLEGRDGFRVDVRLLDLLMSSRG